MTLVKEYIESIKLHIETRWVVNRSIDIISNIASGKFLTVASWIRHFVCNHPSYQKDSIVSNDIVYDLSNEMIKISEGQKGCPLLMGNYVQHPITTKDINEYREMLNCDTHIKVEENTNQASI